MDILNNLKPFGNLDVGDQRGFVRNEAWRRIRAPLFLVGIAFVGLMVVVSLAWGQMVALVFALTFILLVGIVEIFAQGRYATETIVAEAIGHEQVRRRLRALEQDGWLYRGRLRLPNGQEIDHVVWGPKGVFVITSKSDRGQASIESGILTFSGMMPQRHYLQDTHIQVNDLKTVIRDKLETGLWIEGIVCLTRAFVKNKRIDVSKPRTTVLYIESLIDFLESNEPRHELTREDINAIRLAVDNMNTEKED